MKVLIAEDEPVSRFLLKSMLQEWGYEVLVACDGEEAWGILQLEDSPHVAILDWMMPGLDGEQICMLVRQHRTVLPPYLILLTAKEQREDIIRGFKAGASDYLRKPFDREELRARLKIAGRMVEIQKELRERIIELEQAVSQVKTLQGILPVCCYCKRIRNDKDYWDEVEHYLTVHSNIQLSHGICPECIEKYLQPQIDALQGSNS